MTDFGRNGHGHDVDVDRVAWLQRLAEAAHVAADDLRALDDPVTHRDLIEDLDRFHARVTAEIDAVTPGGESR